jgi:hypothetical protein
MIFDSTTMLLRCKMKPNRIIGLCRRINILYSLELDKDGRVID